ncbi:MAG TPA: response regulator [Bacteroidetes bacterium]|nr:response regulator [Bacteroidota bacterium]
MRQRILAVDDEPDMLRLLERILREKTPYDVQATSSSLEVPRLLEANRYDVLLTDLKMPGLDGIDLLKWLGERKRREKVIIMTAFGSLETVCEAMSQGACAYITKPFRKEQIITTLERAMEAARLEREALRLGVLMDLEPFEEAQRRFAVEYVRRLAERHEGVMERMAETSGLDPQRIRELLEEGGPAEAGV